MLRPEDVEHSRTVAVLTVADDTDFSVGLQHHSLDPGQVPVALRAHGLP